MYFALPSSMPRPQHNLSEAQPSPVLNRIVDRQRCQRRPLRLTHKLEELLTSLGMKLHAMSIYSPDWSGFVFQEAMRCWFLSIACSIALLTIEIYTALVADEPPSSGGSEADKPEESQSNEKAAEKPESSKISDDHEKEKARDASARRHVHRTLWRLVGAGCDLLIPGTFVGWLTVKPVVVASASIFSSTMSIGEVWARVNGG